MDQLTSPCKNLVLVKALDREFLRLHQHLLHILSNIPEENLFFNVSGCLEWSATGESLLRSAAIVEQTCGGFMSSLWDDPFEWTLAETLNSAERIKEYFGEVEKTRLKVFARFSSDEDLFKDIAVPSGELRPVVTVIIETLVRAVEHEGRATVTAKSFSDAAVARVII
jgi:hypothetical protein